ncbi:MAG: T9SS type A sorting domain-containing protein, partial [Bacteroidales bacterium]|nr:T9SS type A sorting domain-containing protein [Bacteroidales bacterium]
NSTLDKAFVSFNEGDQLGKFYFGTQDANICLPQGGEEYAIAFSEGRGEMPLNFKAHKNGEYSLTVSYRAITPNGVTYLHLVDHLTGADIDLLVTPSYTFNAKTMDYESRFKLVFNANSAEGNDDFAFIDADGNIIVNGSGTVQIIDMLGRVITNVETSYVSTNGMAPGGYVLRLIDGENVRTQKIVVR